MVDGLRHSNNLIHWRPILATIPNTRRPANCAIETESIAQAFSRWLYLPPMPGLGSTGRALARATHRERAAVNPVWKRFLLLP